MNPSVLDIFILSLFDRGLKTAYDLQRRAGVSLGSSVPALRRLEEAGFIKRAAQVDSSKRPRNQFKLTAAGKKMARGAWILLLNNQSPSDFDSILRLVDMAQHYQAKAADITVFLDAVSSERQSLTRSGRARLCEECNPLEILATREAWDVSRRKAEAKFLAELARSLRQKTPRPTKH